MITTLRFRYGNPEDVPAPPDGSARLFLTPEKTFKLKDEAGNVHDIGGGGAGSTVTSADGNTYLKFGDDGSLQLWRKDITGTDPDNLIFSISTQGDVSINGGNIRTEANDTIVLPYVHALQTILAEQGLISMAEITTGDLNVSPARGWRLGDYWDMTAEGRDPMTTDYGGWVSLAGFNLTHALRVEVDGQTFLVPARPARGARGT